MLLWPIVARQHFHSTQNDVDSVSESLKRTSGKFLFREAVTLQPATLLKNKLIHNSFSNTLMTYFRKFCGISLSGSFQNNDVPWIPCGENRNFRFGEKSKFRPETPYVGWKNKVIPIYPNVLFLH